MTTEADGSTNAPFASIGGVALRPENQREVCVCAAILMPDGYVVRGHRHDGALKTAFGMTRYDGNQCAKAVQGFLTTRERFVTREEAAALHKAAGRASVDPNRIDFPTALFSEDLY